MHHIGITQRPHDHLFQKSRQLVATWVHKLHSKQARIDKFEFCFMIVTKYINTFPDRLYGSICSHYIYFIILVSHRCLMTIYFKSRGIRVQLGCIINGQASKNRQIRLYNCNQIHYQIGFMGQFVLSICKSSYRRHTEAS